MNLEEATAIAKVIENAYPNIKLEAECLYGHPQDIRFKLTTSVGEVHHLVPDKADWHTYYLFVQALEAHYRLGIQAGLKLAAERMQQELTKTILGK